MFRRPGIANWLVMVAMLVVLPAVSVRAAGAPAAPASQATLASSTTAPSVATELITKGNNALISGDDKAARDAFTAAVNADGKNVRALHGLGLANFRLGDIPKARESMERALAAAGPAPDRALVLNLSLVHVKQNNSARAIKLIRDALMRPSKDLDEPMLNALGIAMSVADDATKKNSAYQQAIATYKTYTIKLEAKRSGMKRWGIEWLSSEDANAKFSSLDQSQKRVDRLKDDLATASRRVDDAQKDVAKKQDQQRHGFASGWEVRQAEDEVRRAKREFDSAKSDYDKAVSEIERPSFPTEWDSVAIDDVTPPATDSGDGVASGKSRFDDNGNSNSGGSSSGSGGIRFKEDQPKKTASPPPDTRSSNKQPKNSGRSGSSSGNNRGGSNKGDSEKPSDDSDGNKSQRPKMEYAAAFPIGPDLLVTAAATLKDASDLQVQAHDGTPIKAEVVRSDDKSGLALLRISGVKMAYLDLAPSFTGGNVKCAGFPEENLFEPTAIFIKGNASRGSDGWKIKLDKHPRIPGAPLLNDDGKIVGVTIATEHDLDVEQLPATSLDQLRRFIGGDLPRTPGDKPEPLSVMLQVAVTH